MTIIVEAVPAMTITVVKKGGHEVVLIEPNGALLLLQERYYCSACSEVGALHCANPEECGQMEERSAIYAQSFSVVSPHIAKLIINKP